MYSRLQALLLEFQFVGVFHEIRVYCQLGLDILRGKKIIQVSFSLAPYQDLSNFLSSKSIPL